jgi:acyl-CoA synthetase (AMP-forming)/AMP-acid ligase II/acyl carrier protein
MGGVAETEVAAGRTRTPTEEMVASVWTRELQLPHIGLDEDFIDLGSHSLQGVAVVARLQEIFGVAIPLRVLFEEPTVADLAAWIDRHWRKPDGARGEIIHFGAWIERQRADTGGTQAEIICLQAGSGLRPVFAVPEGRAAARALYGLAKLARETDLHRPFYAFPGDPPVPSDTPEESWVQAAAASLNDAVRTRQRHGPYLLFGSCIGGIIAWEMARQLEASGEVVHLFLVDTKHPRARRDAEARARTEKRMRRSDRKVTNLRLEKTKAYRPEPLVGRVRLLANTDWHRDHPTLGWDAPSIDWRDVVVMPKEHGIWLNFTAVAGWLRTGLDVVDPQPQSSVPVERRSPPSDLAVHSAMAGMAPPGAASTPATIVDALTGWAERSPDAAAVVGPEDDVFTYRRLAVEVDRLAGVLRRIGVERDDPIFIVLPDGPALVTMILASMTAGIAAPLAWDMTRHEYIEAMSNDAGCIVVLPAGQESPARDAAAEFGLPLIELALAPPGTAERFHLVGEPIGPPAASRRPQADDIALVISSSGTTGRPERVPRTHRNISTTSTDVCGAMAVLPSDCCLGLAPMAFSQGLNALLTTVWAGASHVAAPGFDLARLPDWFSTYRPTWFSTTPSVLRAIAIDEAASSTIRMFPPRFIRASAGGISAAEIAYLEERLATPVLHSYGLSEASFIAGEHFGAAVRKPGSAGLPNHEVAIVEADGTPVAAGDTGEIVVRGPNVFPGYLGDPEANAAVFLAHGWFRTGDVGRIDEDGYLFVTGRLKEMIKRAGMSISPGEIEDALMDDPAVAEVCVFGIPHPDLGEDVAAAVVLRPGMVVTERRLRDRVASRLSAQKVPRVVAFVTEIPKTPTGKPMRGELAAALGTPGKRPAGSGFSSRSGRRGDGRRSG